MVNTWKTAILIPSTDPHFWISEFFRQYLGMADGSFSVNTVIDNWTPIFGDGKYIIYNVTDREQNTHNLFFKAVDLDIRQIRWPVMNKKEEPIPETPLQRPVIQKPKVDNFENFISPPKQNNENEEKVKKPPKHRAKRLTKKEKSTIIEA